MAYPSINKTTGLLALRLHMKSRRMKSKVWDWNMKPIWILPRPTTSFIKATSTLKSWNPATRLARPNGSSQSFQAWSIGCRGSPWSDSNLCESTTGAVQPISPFAQCAALWISQPFRNPTGPASDVLATPGSSTKIFRHIIRL